MHLIRKHHIDFGKTETSDHSKSALQIDVTKMENESTETTSNSELEDEVVNSDCEPQPCSSKSNYYSGEHTRQVRQPLITETIAKIKSFQDGGRKSSQITNALIYMITKDNLPLNTTEKVGFKYFVQTTTPLYTIPGRKSVTALIDDKYDVLVRCLKSKISNINHFNLTTDIWTETMNTKSFLGITCHYIDEDKLKSIVIAVYELSSNHTAEYITDIIKKVCESWDICINKISAVVTDNGANMVKAISLLFGKNKHLPCFAHTLDLVATKIMTEVGNVTAILKKVKVIVTYFKHSVAASDELRKAQPQENKLKLIQSVPTRWNSTFYMIERYLMLYKYLVPILLNTPKSPPITDSNEIEALKEILLVLKPIEAVSKEISGEQYITSSKIIPLVNCLKQQLNNVSPKTEQGKNILELTKNEILKRFGSVESVKLLACSTFLDPRFKKIHFNNPEAVAQTINNINNLCKEFIESSKNEQLEQTVSDDATRNTQSFGLWTFHETLAKKSSVTGTDSTKGELFHELKLYMHQPLTELKTDPLDYWKSSGLKVLKEIAYKYLLTVGSSVPCERLFSKAGNIMTERPNRLDAY
ncbi:unnamed protein product [Psylliodes chrysocephalus]|uniref:HAT C-terminal dimerisation domain-containing protein n=1 Tax=Psylliodes chrysocephalus TaxID=3402493 RepID=A0A9P0CLL4_9CUCU|nr:unnamed protein product [Psylliodes chrysocephala]